MTIRFAAAWGGSTPVILKALCPSAPLSAANDNRRPPRLNARNDDGPAGLGPDLADQLLTDTLRHFGRYGLAAATEARIRAEAAEAIGNDTDRDRWIAICSHLDRRMADACKRNLARGGSN